MNDKKPTSMSNGAYDKLKFLAQVLLPGIGTLYFSLAAIWGLPKADEVVGSITAVDTFLGLFLVLGSRKYMKNDARFDGHILVKDNEEEGTSSINVQMNPDSLTTKNEVTLKVKDLSRTLEGI